MALSDAPYVAVIGMAEPLSASGTVPDSYWLARWLDENPGKTEADYRAKQKTRRAEAAEREVAERLALIQSYRDRLPILVTWSDEAIQAVIDTSYDLLTMDDY